MAKISKKLKYKRFSDSRDGVLIINSKTGKIVDINPFLENLLGFPKESLVKKNIWGTVSFKKICKDKKSFDILQKKGHVTLSDIPLKTKNKEDVHVEFDVNTYELEEKIFTQFNIHDISEKKKAAEAENSLRLLRQEQLKSRFIADATHELRTPLAIIKGNVDLAMRSKAPLPASAVNSFNAINEEIKHLADLLSDLTLLITQGSEYKNTLISQKLNLYKLITHAVVRCQTLADEKEITINVKYLPNTEIIGNKNYLEKSFSNIITNAIIYGNKKGKIDISFENKKKGIVIKISDNGIGISKDELAHIFDRFYRAKKAIDVNRTGTGLGLAISKWAAEAHGGSLLVESEENKGTTFIIKLPTGIDL